MAKLKIGAPVKTNFVGGKGSRQEFLPSPHALAKLTKGDPFQRSMGMFAKRTPSGLGAPSKYADIQAMGELGVDLKKK